MKVSMKGVNRVRKRLSDGSTRTYYYAWKGGPRLPGEPGSPEFIAAYEQANREKPAPHAGTLQALLTAYQMTPYFTEKAPVTRKDYVRHIRQIEAEFGDLPIEALADRRVRGEFLRWRDRLAERSRRQADYTISVLALILAWAYDRGDAPANPLERPSKTYRADRSERIWSEDDEAAFLAVAPEHIARAFTLAIWTGQRQGDLLKMPWSAYDGQAIKLRQGKGRRRVTVPVAGPLRAMLDAAPRDAVTILTTSRKTAWTSDGFRASWAKVCERAGIEDLTFHDLRGTAVTRLAIAGCTVPEIAAITGHSLGRVGAILDSHYLSRDSGLAQSAITKLEKHRKSTDFPN